MEFRKQHDISDTTDFCPARHLVTDLLRICYWEATWKMV